MEHKTDGTRHSNHSQEEQLLSDAPTKASCLPTLPLSQHAQQTNSTMTSSTSNKRIKTTESARDTNATTQNRLLVPTATATKDTKGLDLRSMTAEDLKLLQQKGKHTCCCSLNHSLYSDDRLTHVLMLC